MSEIEKKDVVVKQPVKQEKNLSFEEQKQKKSLQNRLSKIESEIQNLEKQIAQDDKLLAENYEKMMNDMSFFKAYEKKKKDLENLLNEWETVQMELEGYNYSDFFTFFNCNKLSGLTPRLSTFFDVKRIALS